ncbi:iron-sulfur cluster scaffold-like protein [Mycoplasma simbae]|uniref:iron-sulfur cluster scaffold-like protein n=1 Tax=Mycoplasma simbae TaxID=36744 RepID=UPI00056AB56F
MSYNQNEKRSIIMAHYLKPNNKKSQGEAKTIKHGQACADYLEFNFDVVDNKINNLSFDAKGCAFMISSSDLLIDQLQGKSVEFAQDFIEKYESFVKNGHIENEQTLGELAIFNNVKEHPNRFYCATMLSSAIKEKLNG